MANISTKPLVFFPPMDSWLKPIKFPKLSEETKKLVVAAKGEFFQTLPPLTQLPRVLVEIIYVYWRQHMETIYPSTPIFDKYMAYLRWNLPELGAYSVFCKSKDMKKDDSKFLRQYKRQRQALHDDCSLVVHLGYDSSVVGGYKMYPQQIFRHFREMDRYEHGDDFRLEQCTESDVMCWFIIFSFYEPLRHLYSRVASTRLTRLTKLTNNAIETFEDVFKLIGTPVEVDGKIIHIAKDGGLGSFKYIRLENVGDHWSCKIITSTLDFIEL